MKSVRFAVVDQRDVWDGQGLRERVCLLDVRTPAEFREVHIPGSTNVPLGDTDALLSVVQEHPDETTAIVCHTRMRSQVVQRELEELGGGKIPILRGGVTGWIDAGLPVVRGEKAVSLQRQVQIGAGSLVVIGVLLGAFVQPWFLLLPGLVGAGLIHAGSTGTCWFATVLARLPFNRS